MLDLKKIRKVRNDTLYLLKSVYDYGYDDYSHINVDCFKNKKDAEKLKTDLENYKLEASEIMGYICDIDEDFDLSAVKYHSINGTALFVLDKDQESLLKINKTNKVSLFTYLINKTNKLNDFFADEFSSFLIEEINFG